MATTSNRVNIISLLALLFLVAVIALTPEGREGAQKLADLKEGVKERWDEARRDRETAPATESVEAASKGANEDPQAPRQPLPPHVVIGADGNYNPEPGWGWVNDDPGDYSVQWHPGIQHPEHPNVFSSQEPDQWHPGPGYDWANPMAVNDMSVVWVPNKEHPDHPNVVSSQDEGQWYPELGYRWVDPQALNDFQVEPGGPGPDGEGGVTRQPN